MKFFEIDDSFCQAFFQADSWLPIQVLFGFSNVRISLFGIVWWQLKISNLGFWLSKVEDDAWELLNSNLIWVSDVNGSNKLWAVH